MKISELKLAKDLIRKPSITPKDAGAINLLAKNLKSIGFNCKIINFKNIKNLYAKLGKSSPNFCYAGHTDVVPPGEVKNWTTNPFKPIVRNNKLIGRGANDMKASIACFVAAVSRFKNENKNFKGSISLLITGDEEGIAVNGTKRLIKYLKRKREKINFCIVGEPTNPNKLGEMIKIGRRGSLTGRLTIIGSQGHVAYPHRANNPSNTLIKILKKIKDLKLDKGTKNFQPSNLEVTKINIDNHADNVIPGSADVSSSISQRTDANSEGDSATNKAQAELDSHTTYYATYGVGDGAYLKVGYVEADLNTLETLGTGSKYANETINGWEVGAGVEFDAYMGSVGRLELTHIDYGDIEIRSSVARAGVATNNLIEADLDVTTLSASLGYKF